MNKKLAAISIFTAIISANSAQAGDEKVEREKCYGVAKAEKNDCHSKDGSNFCAGLAKKDNDPNNWVYVPVGLCEKLVGGAKG